jgi:hypothetical protein
MAITGTIKLGVNTSGHKAWLEAKGYAVKVEGDTLHIEGSEFVEFLDLGMTVESAITTLKGLVEKKQLLTYTSKVKIGEKTYWGVPLCGKLGAASALVTKGPKAGPKAASGFNW